MGEPPTVTILARSPSGGLEELSSDAIRDLGGRTDGGGLVWVHLYRPDLPTLEELAAAFGIHPLALEDLQKQRQRPKVDAYEGQYHLVAYEASPSAANGLAEVQLLVGRSWMLSAHWEPAPMVRAVLFRATANGDELTQSVAGLVYLLLDAATDSYFPELDRLSDRIERLEDEAIEESPNAGTLREILALRRRLLEQRRVLAPMRDVANALLRNDAGRVDPHIVPYYQDLYDHLVRVLDQLDLYRDLLAAVIDARMSAISNDLNKTVRRLTAITVVIMVPTLIAGIYGMNFTFMPELEWPIGYPLALALMVVAAVGALLYFRRQGWF